MSPPTRLPGPRDAQVASILGSFFGILALPVLAGCFFVESAIDLAINLGAGLLLMAVGIIFVAAGRRSRS